MMPELGKYTFEVYAAYAATGVLLAALIIISVFKSRKVAAALRIAEERHMKTKKESGADE